MVHAEHTQIPHGRCPIIINKGSGTFRINPNPIVYFDGAISNLLDRLSFLESETNKVKLISDCLRSHQRQEGNERSR
jgi:hypothetical protein